MIDILSTPMRDNDGDAPTIRDYLVALLAQLWEHGEGFSGKRPFGNRGWQHVVYHALVTAGHLDGRLDEDGFLEEVDERAADRLIARAITAALGAEEIPEDRQIAYRETQWCVWYGGPDPANAAGLMVRDDEEDAREFLQWVREDGASGVASRTLLCTPWQAVDLDTPREGE